MANENTPRTPDEGDASLRIWNAFRHDVNVATSSLLYLLDCTQAMHLAEKKNVEYRRDARGASAISLEDAVRAWGNDSHTPEYPRLRAGLSIYGEPLFTRTATNGPIEQTLLRGYIVDIFGLWERRYRNHLKRAFDHIPGSIRPRQDVLGDMRLIRNDLLHSDVSQRNESASCKTLRWFKEGEPMRMRLWHIFDFLNQMGWLHADSVAAIGDGSEYKSSAWIPIKRDREPDEPAPALVSVRPLVDEGREDLHRYGVSVVFEDCVFGRFPLVLKEESEDQKRATAAKLMKMTVNEDGDLCVPDLATVSATRLYFECLYGEKKSGPGVWQPAVQFREAHVPPPDAPARRS